MQHLTRIVSMLESKHEQYRARWQSSANLVIDNFNIRGDSLFFICLHNSTRILLLCNGRSAYKQTKLIIVQ
jgi:hypothetical protein